MRQVVLLQVLLKLLKLLLSLLFLFLQQNLSLKLNFLLPFLNLRLIISRIQLEIHVFGLVRPTLLARSSLDYIVAEFFLLPLFVEVIGIVLNPAALLFILAL